MSLVLYFINISNYPISYRLLSGGLQRLYVIMEKIIDRENSPYTYLSKVFFVKISEFQP